MAPLALACGLTCLTAAGSAHSQSPQSHAELGDFELDAWETSDEPEELSDKRFSAKVGLGGVLRGVWSEPLFGTEIELGFGAKMSHSNVFIYGTAGYMRAETIDGLNVHRGALGVSFEWELERWRVGIGPQLSAMLVPRITSAQVMVALGAGMEGLVSVDLYRGEGGDGLFLALHAGTALQFPAPYYGGSLRFGYRY